MDIVTNNISTHWYDQNEVVRWYHNFMVILTGRMFCPPNLGFEWIWDTIYMSSDQAVWEADWLLSLNRPSRRSNIKMTNEVKNGILQISEGSTACSDGGIFGGHYRLKIQQRQWEQPMEQRNQTQSRGFEVCDD